jgi:hypothetical protein
VELHRILEALKLQDLEPALKWSAENREALIAQGSSLEFKLHRLAFLNLVKKGRGFQSEAISYARQNFSQFVKRHERGWKFVINIIIYTCNNSNKLNYFHRGSDPYGLLALCSWWNGNFPICPPV